MKQLVIMPGGFHPFHAGHMALYNAAKEAFPDADVYVAATNDTSTRPFPFAVKEKLAKLAGVDSGHFVQVKSPFQAREITQNYDPESTELIFVRSTKDQNKPPQAGGVKKDGNPGYLQPLNDDPQPMNKNAYMAYLPTVEFGPGMTSATEIRNAWPTLNEKRKTALVMSLYPNTQTNPKLAANVVKMLDVAIGTEVDKVLEMCCILCQLLRNKLLQLKNQLLIIRPYVRPQPMAPGKKYIIVQKNMPGPQEKISKLKIYCLLTKLKKKRI